MNTHERDEQYERYRLVCTIISIIMISITRHANINLVHQLQRGNHNEKQFFVTILLNSQTLLQQYIVAFSLIKYKDMTHQ